MPQLYDDIGAGYRNYRQPDPRLAVAILQALGPARTIVNVGAGTGSYEPGDRHVVAVEPSLQMIRQRPPGSAQVLQASAMELPFRNASFDAALAVLTIHHWSDRERGLGELTRVARDRVVIMTWDPSHAGFWLIDDYFPDIIAIDRPIFPTLAELSHALGPLEIATLLVPHDCRDGFLGAYWRRPHAYLDPQVRGAISAFSKISNVDSCLAHLRQDLEDGTWARRHSHLFDEQELDLGYRLIMARQQR